MSKTRREVVERVEHTIDGVQYVIIVERTPRGLHASWRCEDCGDRGAPSLLFATVEKAVARAKLNLSEDHGHMHIRK
jgi:hypothetical protein